MASFIVETLQDIDDAILTYAETVFTNAGGAANDVILATGLVGLPLLAMNAVMQFRPMQLSTFTTWAIRYVLILSVATTWAQFEPIFNILTNVPGNYGAALLGAAGFAAPTTGGLNTAMDTMVTSIFDFSDRASEAAGTFSIDFTGVLLTLLGSIMATVAIIVSAIGKIGLAMSVSLAPIMIATLMFRGTSQMFESWTRFTLGFALIPLVLAGVMGAIISIGTNLIGDAGTATELSQAAGFIIVVLAAVFMMYQIPTLVSGLAGSIVASASAGVVTATLRSGLNAGRNTASNAGGLVGRVQASNREAQIARDSDGTNSQIAQARIAGMRQSTFMRESRREQMRQGQLNPRSSNHSPGNSTASSTRPAAASATTSSQSSSPRSSPVSAAAFTSPKRTGI